MTDLHERMCREKGVFKLLLPVNDDGNISIMSVRKRTFKWSAKRNLGKANATGQANRFIPNYDTPSQGQYLQIVVAPFKEGAELDSTTLPVLQIRFKVQQIYRFSDCKETPDFLTNNTATILDLDD